MAEYHWSVTDEGLTGATWGLTFEVAADGRSFTASRNPEFTNLSNVQTSDIALIVLARVDHHAVNQGATWADLARPVTFRWPDYGLAVDIRLMGRTGGTWTRYPGAPPGTPMEIDRAGATQVGQWEVGENGLLRPVIFSQTDWLVEDRTLAREADPPLRYTTLEAVKEGMRAPTNREAATWQEGDYDNAIDQTIRSAEAWIDSYCNRTFTLAGDALISRSYPQYSVEHVDTDDYIGMATAVGWTRGRVVAVENGVSVYRGVRASPGVGASHLIRSEGQLQPVTVSARWGWPRVPDGVRWAATMLSIRRFKRMSETALGIMQIGEEGALYVGRSIDPDVDDALSPYRRVTL